MNRIVLLLVVFSLCLGSVSRAAGELLYAYNRYPIRSSFSSGGNSFSETGKPLGPYPGIEPVLRAMARDVAEGRLVFLDDPPGFFSPPPEPLGGSSHRAHSDGACPYRTCPRRSRTSRSMPVENGSKRASPDAKEPRNLQRHQGGHLACGGYRPPDARGRKPRFGGRRACPLFWSR